MLDQNIIEQLRTIFAGLGSEITFSMRSRHGGDGASGMLEFLRDIASVSPRLSVDVSEADVEAPVFGIVKDGVPTGVEFCGIPNGHEFTTLLMSVLNADGQGKNIPDEALKSRIMALKGPVRLRTFVSLTCTNCPDVAQALNLIALLNPDVENMVIDGAVVPDMVKALDIQSVPTVYDGDRRLAVGRSSLGDLLSKLEALYGSTDSRENVVREYDVSVLGGGPAGVAAAIYCARKGFRTAVVAETIGGQVKDTMGIENLISVPETTGPKLASDLRTHLAAYPVDVFEHRRADTVKIDGAVKEIVCNGGGETFRSKALVIATGAGWRRLSVPGEAAHIGHGVAFCTHCDGPFYAGRNVAVVGGGNSGIEAAVDLAAICPHVDVFEFMDTLKADNVLIAKAASMPNIDIHLSSQVTAVEGDGKAVSGIKVKDRVSGEESSYPVSGIFVQIGLVPNSSLFRDTLRLTSSGEIQVDRGCRTSVKGVYAAGDVTDVPYKQIVIAMGEGGKAALSLFEDSMRGELG